MRVRGAYQISSIEHAKSSSGSTPAPAAQPSSSSMSHGIAGAVRSRYRVASASWSSFDRPAGRSSHASAMSARIMSRVASPI